MDPFSRIRPRLTHPLILAVASQLDICNHQPADNFQRSICASVSVRGLRSITHNVPSKCPSPSLMALPRKIEYTDHPLRADSARIARPELRPQDKPPGCMMAVRAEGQSAGVC